MANGTADPKTDSMPKTVRREFSSAAFSEFLNSGWMLTLDAQRILIGWGAWSESSEPSIESSDSLTSCSLFAPDFYLQSKKPWKFTSHWDILDRDLFASHVLESVQSNVNANDQGFQWVEPEFSGFESQFAKIREGMAARGLKKAVPVVYARSRGSFGLEQRLRSLKSLVAQPRHLYVYGFWSKIDDGGGLVEKGMIGATPEILFSKTPGKPVETVALAGTRAKSFDEDAAQTLLKDPKERYEHQLVIEDIQAQLSQLGDVAIGSTLAVELPTLFHLKTRLQSRPRKEPGFEELIRLLHPTPALGLSPRRLGFDEMKAWDDSESRGSFGAPFGASFRLEVGEPSYHCVVAIRNVQWQDDDVRLGSGCGVVPESSIEREWQELKLKRESVKRMLGL